MVSSRHPPAIGDEEADIGDDVLDVGQAGLGEFREGGGALVVGDRIGALGRIEERRIHRAGADGRYRDAALAELLEAARVKCSTGALVPA